MKSEILSTANKKDNLSARARQDEAAPNETVWTSVSFHLNCQSKQKIQQGLDGRFKIQHGCI